MANVLISYFSDYGGTTYDAISSVLTSNGNNILRYNINSKSTKYDKWGGNSYCIDNAVLKYIKQFNPDVVLNFNNSLPSNIVLANSCMNCLIDADAPFVFWNKEIIKNEFSKYKFIGLQQCSKKMYEDYFKISLSNNNYLFNPVGTLVSNKKILQNKNISFIGSNFYPMSIPTGLDFYGQEAIKLYKAFRKNYFLTLTEASNICKECQNIQWLYEKVRAYYVGQERLKYMQVLTDLGFTFYGVRWWNKIAYYDFDLAKCFDPTPIVKFEDTEWVYNSSKISVNISHPQAKTSFSWRVMDIMASNACLLMEHKPDWLELFGNFLSKETMAAILYQDQYDLREKAKKLLNNDNLRQKCVADLNFAIEQNGRWEHRLKSLGDFLNIRLIGNKEPGEYVYLNLKFDEKRIPDVPVKTNTIKPKNYRVFLNYKIIYYLVVSFLVALPIINLCVSRKFKNKLLREINKYWSN